MKLKLPQFPQLEDDLAYIRARILVGKDPDRALLWEKAQQLADQIEFDLTYKTPVVAAKMIPGGKVKIFIVGPDGVKRELEAFNNVGFAPFKPITVGKLAGRLPDIDVDACIFCKRNLVDALDAYYGRDPKGKSCCTKCRRERGIS